MKETNMAEVKMETCPVCKLSNEKIVIKKVAIIGERIECPRCKIFSILDRVAFTPPNLKFGAKLSAWIRERNEQGAAPPEITTELLENLQSGLPDRRPREKQIILLQHIERKTTYPSEAIKIVPKFDFPLAWASNEAEFNYYMKSLTERGFLRRTDDVKVGLKALGDLQFFVTITPDGWDYLDQQERHIEERTKAFVAMSFRKDLKAIWEGPIYNAIKKSGYEPYRVDAKPHSNLIDIQIISEIRDSRFVVADFTYQNSGVYFETGYAQGMGLPVIRCVRENDFKNLHFDKNHYNFIIWKTPSDLEGQLYNFICAIIGKRERSLMSYNENLKSP